MTRLYVGNLPYAALAEDVSMLFTSNHFRPTKIDMSTDPFTGRNPSYCFLELATDAEGQRAMQQLTGQLVIGRPVKLNRVTPKRGANSDQHNRSARIRTYDLNWRGQAAPPSRDQGNRGAPYAFDRWASTASASDHWQKPVLDGSRLYIGGLPRIEPQSTAQAEVLKIFDGFNVLAVSKMISPHTSSHSTPGSHYYCFVDLQDAHEAATAVQELNGQPTQWGGTLKVDRARAPGDKVMGEQFRE